MRKFNSTAVGLMAIFVFLVGGAIVAFLATKNMSIPQYGLNDAARPQFIIGQTNFDFGTMSLAETKVQEVPIENNGKSPLVLSDFITSCDCTFVQAIIDGRASPEFSMRRNPDWRGEILPGRSALIKIIYEPKVMPVRGLVKREIIFKTNDPSRPLINLKFIAQVE